MSAVYRVRQFVRATGARLKPEAIDDALLGRHLPPEAIELFRAMPRYDQQHALGVFRALQCQGQTDPDLLAAALLHDVGKTMHPAGGLGLWHRVATVLVDTLRPGLIDEIGREQPDSWRWPFYVQQHHAAIGAELALQAGCSPVTVGLIRRHEDPSGQTDDPLLAALLAADSEN